MEREAYLSQVLANLHRCTPEEQDAIRAEIDGHIEDHVCDLLDLGYDGAVAEERAMSFMGDPTEVGRELDRQYPMRWLVLGRAALVLTIFLVAQALLGVGAFSSLLWSLEARWTAAVGEVDFGLGYESRHTDIRMRIGDDVVRIYAVGVGQGKGERVQVAMCAYDRFPGGIVSDQIFPNLTLMDQRGASDKNGGYGGSGKSNWGAVYRQRTVLIQPGDTYFTAVYERFGERVSVNIPLGETEGAA